jgi:hypothetical protein
MSESMGDTMMIKMKSQRGDLFSAILCVASIGIIGFCLYVYLHTASYVMPAADDFMISADIKNSRLLGEGYLHLGLNWMREIYLTWQGTFTSNFLLYFIAPYVRMGVDGVRLFCIINILLFYGSLWMVIQCVIKYLLKCKKRAVILFVCALITWMVSNARVTMEVFFWYNGICVYTLPLIFTLLGIRHLIKYAFIKDRKRDFAGAVIFGVLASGGVLQCSAIVCFVYLLICIWGFMSKYPRRKKLAAAFITAFIGALINCLAPGNFTRQGAINESGLSIFKALAYSLSNVIGESGRLLSETDMPYLLAAILLMGFLFWHQDDQERQINVWMIILAGLGVFLCMWVACYPVALGYSSALMEPRGYFIVDVFLLIGFIICMFMVGGYLRQLLERYTSARKVWYGISVMATIIVCVVLNTLIPVKEVNRPLQMCVEDGNFGYLVRFRDMWEEILEQIENAEEVNVTVQSKLIPSPQELKNPDLSSDPNYWINIGVARYFGKETVQIEWME